MINYFKELEVSDNLKDLFKLFISEIGEFKVESIEINNGENACPKNLTNVYKLRMKRKDGFIGYLETIDNLSNLHDGTKLSSIIGSEKKRYF